MNLRQLAETDLGAILEDSVNGFGWPINLVSPSEDMIPLTGFSNDISQTIDPDTGQAVSGRLASVALRMSSIKAAGWDTPRGVQGSDGKPWLVKFDDILGQPYTFKIVESNPDRGLGLLTCLVEFYRD